MRLNNGVTQTSNRGSSFCISVWTEGVSVAVVVVLEWIWDLKWKKKYCLS